MTDPGTTSGQAPNAGQPPAGNDPDPKADLKGQDPTGQDPKAGGQDDTPKDPPKDPTPQSVDDLPEWARTEITNVRNEAASNRTKLRAAERRVSELESARGSADEELATENSTLKEDNDRLRNRVRRSAFIETIGLPNARAAWGYVLDGTVEVEYDDNDRPQKLDAVRKALREEDASLFGNGSADGGRTTNGSGYSGAPGRDRLAAAYDNN